VIVPEIADYEVRRELIRLNSRVAVSNLDQLALRLEYPLTTAAMRLAAELWAQARSTGAQALSLKTPIVVATANPAHVNRFVPSELWSNITP
jgi:hypothetical protein